MLIFKTTCHQGLVREQNEDSFISNSDESFWMVADGVGGNVGGDIASQLAVQTAERHLRQGENLVDSIAAANEAVLSAISKQPDLQGMATTIVSSKFDGKNFELSWVGDSRAYLINNNSIQQLSSDHNHANELFLQGNISKEEATTHSGQHELTQALGQLSLGEIPILNGTLSSEAILLLCTDGLSGVLSDKKILNTFKGSSSLEDISRSLLTQVLEAGAPDNVTFTLVAWKEPAENLNVSDESIHGVHSEQEMDKQRRINKAPLTWLVLSLVVLMMMILIYVG